MPGLTYIICTEKEDLIFVWFCSAKILFSLAQRDFYIHFSDNVKNLTACISNIRLYAISKEQIKGPLRKGLLFYLNCVMVEEKYFVCFNISDVTEGQTAKKKHPQVLVLALPNTLFQIRGKIPGCTVLDEIKSLSHKCSKKS